DLRADIAGTSACAHRFRRSRWSGTAVGHRRSAWGKCLEVSFSTVPGRLKLIANPCHEELAKVLSYLLPLLLIEGPARLIDSDWAFVAASHLDAVVVASAIIAHDH